MARRSTKPRRRSAALSAELDRFLEEVFDAVSAAMTARRWQDVSPMLDAYAAAYVGLTAAGLFHGALAHRIARHALSLTDRDQFHAALPFLGQEILLATNPPPLEATIEYYRSQLALRDAQDVFDAIATNSKGVH
jgi:hypothetical protein